MFCFLYKSLYVHRIPDFNKMDISNESFQSKTSSKGTIQEKNNKMETLISNSVITRQEKREKETTTIQEQTKIVKDGQNEVNACKCESTLITETKNEKIPIEISIQNHSTNATCAPKHEIKVATELVVNKEVKNKVEKNAENKQKGNSKILANIRNESKCILSTNKSESTIKSNFEKEKGKIANEANASSKTKSEMITSKILRETKIIKSNIESNLRMTQGASNAKSIVKSLNKEKEASKACNQIEEEKYQNNSDFKESIQHSSSNITKKIKNSFDTLKTETIKEKKQHPSYFERITIKKVRELTSVLLYIHR